MSRSGYGEGDDGSCGLWENAVKRAARGKRGQNFFRALASVMDTMPKKELIANNFEAEGQFCTIAVLGAERGIDMQGIDPEDVDYDGIGEAFNIAPSLVREIFYQNDEAVDTYFWMKVEVVGPMPRYSDGGFFRGQEHIIEICLDKPVDVLNARRWKRMRKWVAEQLIEGSKT